MELGYSPGAMVVPPDVCHVPKFAGEMWSDLMEDEHHHEKIYPSGAGEGIACDPIEVSNATTDDAWGTRQDKNYWGDIVRLIPPDVLSSSWASVGIYVSAISINKTQQWQIFYVYPEYVSKQDGGNDWDQGETILTLVNSSKFQARDLVWVTGMDRADGEILKVVSTFGEAVTVASEARASNGGGLRYDYDANPGMNRMYLVYRPTDKRFHTFEGDFSASSPKDFTRIEWHAHRKVSAGGGMLIRTLNVTDPLYSAFDVRAIYED